MKILQQRLLRGANLYARFPCLLAVVDLEDLYQSTPADLGVLEHDLVALVPTLAERRLFPMPAHLDAAWLVEQLTLELQALAGAPAEFGATGQAEGGLSLRRIVCSYQIEHIAQASLALAVQLVDALAHGKPFEFAPAFAGLLKRFENYRIDPLTASVLRAAAARSVPATRVTEHQALYQLGWGSRQRRYHPLLRNDSALMGSAMAQDRQLTRALLDEACVPVPAGGAVDNLDDALRVARRLGGTVLVMPCAAGAGIGTVCADEAEVARAFDEAQLHGRRVIVERFLAGARYRVDIAQGVVVGDAAGAVPAAVPELCARASTKIGLQQGTVDIVCDPDEANLRVVAVRAGATAADDTPREHAVEDAESLLDRAFGPGDDGRIPVIAITGTNGKTTTTLLVAHATALAGRRTGYTTTHGVSIGGCLVAAGDCTGYWSHRAILGSPDVDVAVLETARGGLLKRGLAYDECTVGVVLNVSDDHLGLEGVATVEDLARVKSLVASSAAGAAVLNADDPHCVAMARRLDAGAELMYFSMEPDNGVVRAHLAEGGRAVLFDGGSIVVASAGRRDIVMAVRDIPCTLGGRARYNVANCLAATAALLGAGFSLADIAAGLGSFVSDVKNNPLRTNIFDVRGVTVIVDYAHNPAAYASLAEMAHAMASGAVVGVVTSPGDRRDEELQHTGRICAGGFDKLVVYESASRGRPYGEAANMILGAALAASGNPSSIHGEHDRLLALRRALAMCAPGDVLAYCGTSVSALVDALLPLDPESAQAIAAQIGE